MKVSILAFALSVFSLNIFTGCSGDKHDLKVLDQLDSAYSALGKTKEQLMRIDSIKVAHAYLEVEKNLEYLKNNYRDAGDSASVMLISRYRSIRKPFEKFASFKKNVWQELNYTRLQVQNLKHDVKAGIIKEEKLKNYIDDEIKAIQDLQARLEAEFITIDSKLKAYDAFQPEIEKIIGKIKSTVEKEVGS